MRIIAKTNVTTKIKALLLSEDHTGFKVALVLIKGLDKKDLVELCRDLEGFNTNFFLAKELIQKCLNKSKN